MWRIIERRSAVPPRSSGRSGRIPGRCYTPARRAAAAGFAGFAPPSCFSMPSNHGCCCHDSIDARRPTPGLLDGIPVCGWGLSAHSARTEWLFQGCRCPSSPTLRLCRNTRGGRRVAAASGPGQSQNPTSTSSLTGFMPSPQDCGDRGLLQECLPLDRIAFRRWRFSFLLIWGAACQPGGNSEKDRAFRICRSPLHGKPQLRNHRGRHSATGGSGCFAWRS